MHKSFCKKIASLTQANAQKYLLNYTAWDLNLVLNIYEYNYFMLAVYIHIKNHIDDWFSLSCKTGYVAAMGHEKTTCVAGGEWNIELKCEVMENFHMGSRKNVF